MQIRFIILLWGHLPPPQMITTNHLDHQITPIWALQVVHPKAHQVAPLQGHQASHLWAGPLTSLPGPQACLEACQTIHLALQVRQAHQARLALQPAILETLGVYSTPIMSSSNQTLYKGMEILMQLN